MYEEIAKLLAGSGNGVLQFFGGCLALVIGAKLAFKGQSDVKTAPTPPQEVTREMEVPDWFARKIDDIQQDVQRIKWVVEDLRNNTE